MSKVIHLLAPRNDWMRDIYSHLRILSFQWLGGKKSYLFNRVFKRLICSMKCRCSQCWGGKTKLYDFIFVSQSCLQTTQTITRAAVTTCPNQWCREGRGIHLFWILASPLSQCRPLLQGKCHKAERWRLGTTSIVGSIDNSIQIVPLLFQKMWM